MRHAGDMTDDDEPKSRREEEARGLRQLWAVFAGDDSDDAQLMRARFVATAAGMARVCTRKPCRRRKRCLGDPPLCMTEHLGLMYARLPAAYRALGLYDPGGKHGRSQLRGYERAWRRRVNDE